MTRFVGWVRLEGGPIRTGAPLRHADDGVPTVQGASDLSSPDAAHRYVLRSAQAVFTAAGEGQLVRGREGRVLFAASVRLDNRDEIARWLGLSAAQAAAAGDAALLYWTFERAGGDGVARCLGAFAFAHWDEDARRLTLGRDCLGSHALLFHAAAPSIVFSNRLGALLKVPGVPRAIDEAGAANMLVVNRRDPRRTIYRGIERVPSRSLVTIDCDGVRQAPYWSPNLRTPRHFGSDADAVVHARGLFDQAVRTCTAGTAEVAIALSGGLDSSAIAATLVRLGRVRRIVCYTSLPPADAAAPTNPGLYRDERDKVEALGRMYPQLDLNFIDRYPADPAEQSPDLYFGQALVPSLGGILSIGLVQTMSRLLAPHGRALFGSSGNMGLTWTGQFSLPALLRAGNLSRFGRELGCLSQLSGHSRGRIFVDEVLRPTAPAWLRRLRHGRDHWLDEIAQSSALNRDFIGQAGLRQQWREQGFDPGRRIDAWHPAAWRAWHLFDKTGPDRDNPSWVGDAYGFEVRDPFADRRLLEFALQVPEPLFRREGVPRSFARAVFADRLPAEILGERRRGANTHAWFRVLDRQKPAIAAQIEWMAASPTAQRLFDMPRLKRLVDAWPSSEAEAERRHLDYRTVLARAVHVGAFVRWVEAQHDSSVVM